MTAAYRRAVVARIEADRAERFARKCDVAALIILALLAPMIGVLFAAWWSP